jgi:O-antigen/teichoic acid export membrane protein
MFITMAVSLYTVRIVLNVLSVQDYGLYGAVGGIILAFSFISSVLDNASQRFFSYELGKDNEGKLQETFSTLYIIYLLVTVIIILLAETIGLWFLQNKMTIPAGRETAAMWVYQFALASFIVTIMATPYRAMIIAQEKMSLYAYLSIFDAIAKLMIAYLLMIYHGDKLIFYAILLFGLNLVNNLVYYIYCRFKYTETRLLWTFDKTMFRSIFSYSSWTLFGALAGICNTQGVNIVLNIFFGPVANAAYSIASQIYHTVGTFANNFYVAVKPPLIKNYAAGNYDYVHKLFTFSSKSLFTLLSLLAIPLMVCAEEILQLWLGQVGDYMVVFVKLSLVYVVILTISYPITAVVQAGGNVKIYHAVVDGFSLIVLPVVYVLFKIGLDAYWGYIVSVIVFAIAHCLRILVLKRVFNEFNVRKYLIGCMIPMIVIFATTYYVMLIVTESLPDGTWFLMAGFSLTAITVFILCAFILFTQTERQMVLNMIKGWISNKKKNNKVINK